jgi:hypothetical protein
MAILDARGIDLGSVIPGQRITLTIKGTYQVGGTIDIDTIAIGNKQKMSVQQVLMSSIDSKLDRIENKMPSTESRP